MEQPKSSPSKINGARALEVYIAVCALLVLIILSGAFQRTDGGVLSGEIYLRPNVVETLGGE